PAARWPRNLVPAAPSPFPQRRRAHRSLPSRTLYLERRSLQGPHRLRKASRVSEQPARRFFSRTVFHLDSDPLPRPLRRLHLVSRRHERCGVPLDRQLALHFAALDGHHRADLYGAAYVLPALHWRAPANASYGGVRQSPGRIPESVDDRFLLGRHHRRFLAFQLRPVAVLF